MICYLIRHGKDDDSVRGGWSSAGLTEEGVREVEKLAERIGSETGMNVSEMFSSDLPRAKQTAEIISSRLGMRVEYLSEFRETDNGDLAGMKNSVAALKYPDLYWNTLEWDQCYPNGESPHLFFNRISSAWNEFKKKARELNGNVILVTHGGVINVIWHIENNIPYSNGSKAFSIEHTGIISFDI